MNNATKATTTIESENRAIEAARNELTALLDGLDEWDMADTHDVTKDEGRRALEILRGLLAKLEE